MKTSPKRSFLVIENARFGLVLAKTGSINSGTELSHVTHLPFSLVRHNPSPLLCVNKYCAENKRFGLVFAKTGTINFKQSMGARKRVGRGLSYWPARLHRLAELIPWNRLLGSLKV
jgi:hypothetical protein